jgi:hypothetical protein
VAANLDPDVLIRTDPRWPEQRIYGRDAAVAWYRDVWESGGPDISIEETMDLGDRVLARYCWHMRGLHSGVEGEQRMSVISTYRESRAILIEFFLDHEQALAALEMRE